MLTKIESELNGLMRSRDIDFDTRAYILIVLKHESIYKSMIQWIKKNQSARQGEILKQTDLLRPDQPSTARAEVRSSRAKRIAMY